jgi:hypothetical protein
MAEKLSINKQTNKHTHGLSTESNAAIVLKSIKLPSLIESKNLNDCY